MSKPVIAIAARPALCIADPQAIIETRNEVVMLTYIRAVERAGAATILLPTTSDPGVYNQFFDFIDGILLPGGSDVTPGYYGETDEGVTGTWPEVDELDFYLVTEALKRKIPLYGICRGLQIFNVVLGGGLYKDLGPRNALHDNHNKPRNQTSHELKILPGSLAQVALQIPGTTVSVNSLHHQACKDLGDGLIASGIAADGVIEVVELPREKHPFFFGVQCHPEELVDHPYWPNTFKRFVEAANTVRCCRSTAPVVSEKERSATPIDFVSPASTVEASPDKTQVPMLS